MAKKKKKVAGRTVPISYKCAGTCTPSKNPLKIKFGDVVVMKAIGTHVTVRFGGRSPFSRKVFKMDAGDGDSAEVIKKKPATFRYSLKCKNCGSGALPPQMIIDN